MEHSKWVCPFCGGSFWVRTLVTTLTQPFAPHHFCRGQNAVNILMQLAPSPSTQLQPEPPESPSLGATVFRPNHSGALGLALGFSDLFFAVPAHICSPKMDLDGSISTRIAFQELQLRTCSRHLENPSGGSSGELSRCGPQCISSPAEACSQSEMWWLAYWAANFSRNICWDPVPSWSSSSPAI